MRIDEIVDATTGRDTEMDECREKTGENSHRIRDIDDRREVS